MFRTKYEIIKEFSKLHAKNFFLQTQCYWLFANTEYLPYSKECRLCNKGNNVSQMAFMENVCSLTNNQLTKLWGQLFPWEVLQNGGKAVGIRNIQPPWRFFHSILQQTSHAKLSAMKTKSIKLLRIWYWLEV